MAVTQDELIGKKKRIDGVLIDKLTNSLTEHSPDLTLEAFRSESARTQLKELAKKLHPSIKGLDLEDLMAEIVGMGFVERILEKEPEVTDIRFNGTQVTVKTNKTKYIYTDEEVTTDDVERVITRVANVTGNQFNEIATRLDAQFGYMRFNAVHSKNAPYGATMAIRFSKPKLVVTESNFTSLADEYILDLCKMAMRAGTNMILSGIPGSGKTELTKSLIQYLNFREAIITIEDTPEGHFKELFPDLDITSWYTSNNLTESELIDTALRNDVDWLMLTETRTSKAAYALFKGFLTGAKGITSIHAGSAVDIPSRYYNMIKSDMAINEKAFYSDFYKTVKLGFHLSRVWINNKIHRYIDEIVEFTRDGQENIIYSRWEEDGIFYSEVPNKLSIDFQNYLLGKLNDISDLEGTGLIDETE